MNEVEFKKKWELEQPIYSAWGDFIVESITRNIENRGIELGEFLKIPVKSRLKREGSLLDKAFYRPNKNYSDPYNEIEDKVGVRFVVLLLDHIEEICKVVENCDDWVFDGCKHFIEDKEKDPLLFTYQSVHYILRPSKNINLNGITVPTSTACEVQIRTLLQHAHAELTHDAIYKAKKVVQPKVHRTVAKSMALIETTDDFFTSVTRQLNYGPLEEHGVTTSLDALYLRLTGMKSLSQKSSTVIWDEFEKLIDKNLVDEISKFLSLPNYSFLPENIKNKYFENGFYQQSIVFFIYWMLVNKKRRLLQDWPLQRELLEPFAIDLGVSTWDE